MVDPLILHSQTLPEKVQFLNNITKRVVGGYLQDNNNAEFRLQLLEYARQVSFYITTSIDNLNPLLTYSADKPQSWNMKFTKDEQHVRNIFRAIALIERLKGLLDNEPEHNWYVFGELNVTVDGLLGYISKAKTNADIKINAKTEMGQCFLEVIEIIVISGWQFPHYNMHPYVQCFMDCGIEEIYHAYIEALVFPEMHVDALAYKTPIETQMELSYLISNARVVAAKIDRFFVEVMRNLKHSELNKTVNDFEKKAIKNIATFYDFFHQLRTNDNQNIVVIKTALEFHCSNGNVVSGIHTPGNATQFSNAVGDFITKLSKSKTLNGFIKAVHILKAPKSKLWHQECYIALSFPKDGYCFNCNDGALALWDKFDELTVSCMRDLLGKKRSKDYSAIAKELNDLTNDGKDIKKLAAFIKNARKEKEKEKETRKRYQLEDILIEVRRDQVIYDCLALLQHTQDLWHKSVFKSLDIKVLTFPHKRWFDFYHQLQRFQENEQLRSPDMNCYKANRPEFNWVKFLSFAMHLIVLNDIKVDTVAFLKQCHVLRGYKARINAMVLLDKDANIPLIYTPKIIPTKPREVVDKDSARSSLKFNFIKNFLQMQQFPKNPCSSNESQVSDDINVGLETSNDMLLDMIKTSMANLFFMTLKLHDEKTKFNEVRNSFAENMKDKYAVPKGMKTSPSFSAIYKIFEHNKTNKSSSHQ